MISSYLIDIILLLIAAVIIVPLFQVIRLGAVPGFLVAGVIVGPSVLGLIDNVEAIINFAEIGVVLLLFVIGIELKLSRLWLMRRLVFGLGTLQVLITGAVLTGLAYILLDVPLEASILIGPALALSSTAFVLQLLTEQKLLTSIYGRTAISVLLLQDLAVVPLLALVPLLSMPEMSVGQDIGVALLESLVIVALVIFIARYLLHPVLHRVALSRNSELFTASAVLIVLGTALATEHAGLSMAMGAFLAGLLISDSVYRHQVLAEIQPFRGLLLGLFFMSMGMMLNLDLFFLEPLKSAGLLLLLILFKTLLLIPLVILFGVSFKNGLAVSLLLAQSGEFALVLFSLASQSGLLDADLFQQLLLIVLLSMMVTPVLAQLARRLVRMPETEITEREAPIAAPIVLAGYGRVGRRIGEILRHTDRPFVALDRDAENVEKYRALDHPVFYGDVLKPEVLKAAGANDADVIIVTLSDPDDTRGVVATLHKMYPDISIYARGHSMQECRELKQLGAAGAVSENIEASLELASMALVNIGYQDAERESLLNNFRQSYHAQIDEIKK